MQKTKTLAQEAFKAHTAEAFKAHTAEAFQTDVTANIQVWMLKFRPFGLAYMPGNRFGGNAVRNLFLRALERALRNLRPAGTDGIATGAWALPCGLTAAEAYAFVRDQYDAHGIALDAAYEPKPLPVGGSVVQKLHVQHPPRKRGPLVFFGPSRPKEFEPVTPKRVQSTSVLRQSAAKLNRYRRTLNSRMRAALNSGEQATASFWRQLKDWQREGAALKRRSDAQQDFLAMVERVQDKMVQAMKPANAIDWDALRAEQRRDYVRWWHMALKRREERLAAQAARRAELKAQALAARKLKPALETSVDLTVRNGKACRAVLRRVQRRDANGNVVRKHGKVVWDLQLIDVEPTAPQQTTASVSDVNTETVAADVAASLLEGQSLVPAPWQDKPAACNTKRKGPARTEAIADGRVRRKAEKAGDAEMAEQVSAEHAMHYQDTEARRQARGQEWYQQWRQKNAALLKKFSIAA